jgi:hypothetical protein
MATQGREESERRVERQRKSIRKEARDEFKTSTTRGRLKKEIILRPNVRDESEVDFRENSERPKQPD